MGLRFRKSFKIAPGVRLNASTRGLGMSVGRRGASVSVSSRGVYGNMGIPGTGLSYSTRLDSSGRITNARRQPFTSPVPSEVRLLLQDDGRVELEDLKGNPLPPKIKKLAFEAQGSKIQAWLAEQCERWNQGIESILNLHLASPHPTQQVIFTPEPFSLSKPMPTKPKSLGLLGLLFRSRREAIERENAARIDSDRLALSEWEEGRKRHEADQEQLRKRIEVDRFSDPESMQDFLEEVLSRITWPRETMLSLEITPDGQVALLDVDLPEIEDMPTEQASVATRGLKLNIKSRSDTQRRKEYMRHIHAIAFRLVAETFTALPTVETVICSGYSQRINKATGQIADEYLLSVRVRRMEWMQLNFDNLSSIDLPTSLAKFDLRRKMTATGVFTAIEPFASA